MAMGMRGKWAPKSEEEGPAGRWMRTTVHTRCHAPQRALARNHAEEALREKLCGRACVCGRGVCGEGVCEGGGGNGDESGCMWKWGGGFREGAWVKGQSLDHEACA
eukprot:353340-Chlamydomonas_euryale.AAC.2